MFDVVVAPEVIKNAPPVRVIPFEAARPAALTDERVFVAVFVWRIVPPVTVTPFEEETPDAATPPLNVLVAPPVIDEVALPVPRRIC